MGLFGKFYSYIFGRAILLMFQTVAWEVLACVCYDWLCGIVSITIHFSLVIGMVMRDFPVSSYIRVTLFCVSIVFFTVIMFFYRLHSMVEI